MIFRYEFPIWNLTFVIATAPLSSTKQDTDCYAAPISNLDSVFCASLNSEELLTR